MENLQTNIKVEILKQIKHIQIDLRIRYEVMTSLYFSHTFAFKVES